MRWLLLVVVLGVVLVPRTSRADDAVALLPLDADHNLEIYGQPVASEIARALVAGTVDVLVVGPRVGVPERVRLVVDGRIAGDRADNVTITIRVRDRFDGTVLDTLTGTAPLANIDRIAAELAARLLPSVKTILERLHHPPAPDPSRPPPPRPAEPARARLVLISLLADPPFKAPLADAIAAWVGEHHRTMQPAELAALGPDTAVASIGKAGAELAVAFEVDRYLPTPGMVDMARARVRVRISTAGGVAFDRVIVTDTVVGERKITEAELAARVAREVLAIVAPHMHRAVPGW